MYTRPGETLEPLGETGNWGGDNYPYWLIPHQIRVVEEAHG